VPAWSELTIEQCCTRVTSGGTPRRNNPDFYRGGTVPWVKTGELKDSVIDPSAIEEWITEEAIRDSSAKVLPRDTVLMAMYGDGRTIGSLGLVRSPVSCNQACCAMIPNPDICDAQFLFYAIRYYRDAWIKIAHGGAQRNLSGSIIRQRKIAVPSLPIQKRIASILGAYDDLIEVNRRRITVLEEIARRLFDEWFVRFRFPGHESCSRIETPDGPMPEGWQVSRIGDLTSFLSRGITPTYDANASSLVINQKCIRNQRLSLTEARTQSKAVPEDKVVLAGDVLVNSTGVGTLGRVAQAEEVPPGITVDSHVTIVRAGAQLNRDFFGLALLRMEPMFERLGAGATGQTELNRGRIADQVLIMPPANLQSEFGLHARPIRSLAFKLAKQNYALAESRDILLPRLVSGELSISSAVRELEAVA